MEEAPSSTGRLVTCLIAGKEAGEAYPSLLHYLQLGLVSEQIDVLRVVLQGESLATLQTGTSALLQDRQMAWPLTHWSRTAFIDQVKRKLESMVRGGPAVIHGLSGPAIAIAGSIAEATGNELVVTLSSLVQAADSATVRLLQRAAAILCLSTRISDALPAGIKAGKRVEVVPVGVSAADSPSAFAEQDRAPVLLFAGPLGDDCGLDCVLRAVKVVLMRRRDLHVFFVGKGPAEDGLRRLAESLDIQPHVTFTGRLEDWRATLHDADMLILPSQPKTWREEAACAMAAGVCVIAPEGGVFDEIIDGRTALTFPPGDDVRLAQRITELLGDEAAARRLAADGQEFVRTNQTPSRMVDAHLRLYRSLLNKQQTLVFPVRA